jgi:hypothetical protein
MLLGFEIEDAPTDDPGHFVLRPGPSLIARGLTLDAWAKTRDGIDELNPLTWHPLTKLLRTIAK